MGVGRRGISMSLDDVAREFVGLFENMGGALCTDGGGSAVRLHALPRPTYDVALTVRINPQSTA